MSRAAVGWCCDLKPLSKDTRTFHNLGEFPLGDSRLGVFRKDARNLLQYRVSSVGVIACLACSGLQMPTPQSGHTLAFRPRSPTSGPRALTQDTRREGRTLANRCQSFQAASMSVSISSRGEPSSSDPNLTLQEHVCHEPFCSSRK